MYVIVDGVRRAKACQLAGLPQIEARIFDQESRHVETRLISLTDLRSRRYEIEMRKPSDRLRFYRVLEAVRNGQSLPPISVMVGRRGLPIEDVVVGTEEEF